MAVAAADLRDGGSAAARPTVSVLVPWRPDGADRDRVWEWLQAWWARTGWEVVTGECPPGPWVKALAVEDALSKASGDVLVVADADVIVPAIGQAVDAVLAGHAWAVPHRVVHRLSRQGTSAVLRGGAITGQALEQRPYVGMLGGGCVVLRRETYVACPLDRRFQGWGQEDQSWGVALGSLCGRPWQPAGQQEPLFHLWHAPQDRVSRSTGTLEGRRLALEYTAAADGNRMAEYLAGLGCEAREQRMTYMYVCKETGQVVESLTPMPRLERLDNWTSHHTFPEPPAPAPEAPVVVPAPFLVQAQAPAVEAVAVADPGDDGDLTEPPKLYAGKLEWLSYARMRGVAGCDGMTKKELQSACGF